ncbi:hypothetical protein CDAR_189271 [Caerostris darwini]|uniref:Uncharacterized protein n=1 Tax=Caerostris darwini TaxID=1538125 RepID=A0AAV4MW63_9ARAC|nr:hypothetical protein CDAR_189271 [Caerostris darwini]
MNIFLEIFIEANTVPSPTFGRLVIPYVSDTGLLVKQDTKEKLDPATSKYGLCNTIFLGQPDQLVRLKSSIKCGIKQQWQNFTLSGRA